MKKLNKITVLYNLPLDKNYLADVDTEVSAKEIAKTLSEQYDVQLMGILPQTISNIQNISADLVFDMIEWSGNNFPYALKAIDLLQKTGIPFTGSDSRGFGISADKIVMKKLMDMHGIPTPSWQVFKTGNEKTKTDLNFPLIVKPALEHCGMGVSQLSLAHTSSELHTKVSESLKEFNQPILAEEFIDGRELHVTVFEKNGKPWVLPATEIIFKKSAGFAPILSYAGKWEESSEEYGMSWPEIAKLTDAQQRTMEKIAIQAYSELGGRDYPRLDMRLRGDDFFVLEINNNPGIDFSLESGFGLSCRAAGFDYLEALAHICEHAYFRFTAHHDAATV